MLGRREFLDLLSGSRSGSPHPCTTGVRGKIKKKLKQKLRKQKKKRKKKKKEKPIPARYICVDAQPPRSLRSLYLFLTSGVSLASLQSPHPLRDIQYLEA